MTIQPHSGEHRTLVVDDHRISRRCAVAAFRQCAGSVQRARTAREALDTALNWLPDLICMDIRLPDLDGLEVIRRIRLNWPPGRPQPRVIIVTADESGLEQNDLVNLDVECLLVKPVSGRQLRKASGLQRMDRARATNPDGPGQELLIMFRQELERRLPELDQSISSFDQKRATGILHQLIASSAICNEPRLEKDLRALDQSIRGDFSAVELARAYYAFLESTDEFLNRPVEL